MAEVDYSDAALILVGHGSTRNADSSAPVYRHADEFRRRDTFAQVLDCFWKLEPGIAGVLRGVFAPRVFIVPLFISEGYFTEQVIPRELGMSDRGNPDFCRVQTRGAQTVFYCHPIGTHDRMTGVILARAQEVVARNPFPRLPKPKDTALFIAGHGTGNNENSRRAIEQHVTRIRERGLYAEVHPAFLEEDPRIGSCYATAAVRNLIVVPFFISDGLHSQEDIPEMLGESRRVIQERMRSGQPTWRNPTERQGKLLWYAAGVGMEPTVAEVILARVREAVEGGREFPR